MTEAHSLRGIPASEVGFKNFCPDVLAFNLAERDTAKRLEMVMLVPVDSTRDTRGKLAKSGKLCATHATRERPNFMTCLAAMRSRVRTPLRLPSRARRAQLERFWRFCSMPARRSSRTIDQFLAEFADSFGAHAAEA